MASPINAACFALDAILATHEMRVNIILYAVYSVIFLAAWALKDYQPTNGQQSTEQLPPIRQALSDVEKPEEIAFVTKRGDLFIPRQSSRRTLLIYTGGGRKLAEMKGAKFLCATDSYAVVASGPNVSGVTLSGEPLWRSQMQWEPFQGICTADRVYLFDFRAILVLSSKGETLWTRNVPWSDMMGGLALDTDGTIYIGSLDGKLFTLDRSGTPLWQTRGVSLSASVPVPDGKGRIYRTDSAHLFAIDKNGGAVIWQSTIATESKAVDSLPVLAPDGRICFARTSLFCFADGGQQKWRFDPDSSGERFAAPPIFDQNGSAYLYSQGHPGRVYAVSNSGKKKWSYPVGDTMFESTPMKFAADDSLWKSTQYGFLSFDFKHRGDR